MRARVAIAALVCAAASACRSAAGAGRAPAGAAPGVAPGVTFIIDSTPDRLAPGADSAAARLFTGYTARVTAVGGRGRIDVLTRHDAAPVAVGGFVLAGPSAVPGDYYLFDSTGVVLVQPRARTYARLAFTEYGVGGPGDRTGWPPFFPFQQIRVAPADAGGALRVASPREVPIYWHLDLNQRTPAFRELARGRLRAVNLPLGDAGVLRWSGPAQALARLPDLGAALAAPQIGVTAVALARAPGDSAGVNFIMQRSLSGLRAVPVELARLAVPAGYTEAPWPAPPS